MCHGAWTSSLTPPHPQTLPGGQTKGPGGLHPTRPAQNPGHGFQRFGEGDEMTCSRHTGLGH